jgi:homoaconitate hydratase
MSAATRYHVSLLLENGEHPGMQAVVASAEKILATIAEVRKGITFDLAHTNASLETPDRQKLSFDVPYKAHAAISCALTGSKLAQEHLDADIRVSCLSLPSSRLVPGRQIHDGENEDINLKVVFLDRSPGASSQNENFISDDEARRLVATCSAIARRSDIGNTLFISDVETQSGTLANRVSILAPQLMVDACSISTDHLLAPFAQTPASLNGVLLTNRDTGLELVRTAKAMAGVQVTSSRIRSLPDTTDTAAVFSVEIHETASENDHNAIGTVMVVQELLNTMGLCPEARALSNALRRTLDTPAYVGSDILPSSLGGPTCDRAFVHTLIHHLPFFLEALNSRDLIECPISIRAQKSNTPAPTVRPMNLIEKIITQAAIGLDKPEVSSGQMVCAQIEWVLTSELLWGGMEKTYDQMKRPRPYRNDRIWLAVDHTVDPRTINLPKQRRLMKGSERFRDEAKIINYLPANTSIMHTDFTREKAQPGTIVVGSDSHTCSAGSMGALAVGFGAADVVMPLVTGQTWFRVPEVCRINFVGRPAYGISGKDVILYVLGLFKRNTIAFQRAVEYGGPGLAQLSMDARFAIANMTTEFGGMGACFEADEITMQWISSRRSRQDRKGGSYFRPDPNAEYAEIRTIDLSQVGFTMALYPNPDDVVPIISRVGTPLHGCFIGACTTTEEELILAALVLEAGLSSGMKPIIKGKRRVTPGSLIISNRLEALGLLEIYRNAGFQIGAPGCSYCVGINDVDVAQEGEVWLSSQNRNFRNRMGKGSFGNITSAAAVAASSFDMHITDPKRLLALIDKEKFDALFSSPRPKAPQSLVIREPQWSANIPRRRMPELTKDGMVTASDSICKPAIVGRIQRFQENVDT